MIGHWIRACLVGALLAGAAYAASPPPHESAALSDHEDGQPYTAEELEQLVGPVALYSDEILPMVLAASTYPLEIVQASRFLEKRKKDESLQPDEGWDDSVKALLNYPEVVTLMNDDLNWTWQLGEAVADQQEDVMDAVQRFRKKAHSAGNLESNDKMKVEEQEVEGEEVIVIESTSTEVVYVPVYQPSTVVVYTGYPYSWYWSRPYPYYWHRRAAFWTGVAFGASWGRYGYSNINIDRDVDIDIDRDIDRNVDRDRDRDRDRAGRERKDGKPEKWQADRSPGSQAGGRPGQANRERPATRPAQGGATRPSTGNVNRAGAGTADRAANRPTQGTATRQQGSADRARRADSADRVRSSGAGSADRARSSQSASRGGHSSHSRASRGSYGSYGSRSSSYGHSSRGSMSRGGRGGGRGGRR